LGDQMSKFTIVTLPSPWILEFQDAIRDTLLHTDKKFNSFSKRKNMKGSNLHK
jgi:hypothetical protein